MGHIVIQSRGRLSSQQKTGHYHGVVLAEDLSEEPTTAGLRSSFIQFQKGAFTKLHYHTGGQVLYVTAGEGFVEFSDGQVYDLKPGTRVIVPPGELHRHGATKDADLEHLAITAGESIWWEADTTQAGPR